MKLNIKQIEHIMENHDDTLNEVIHENIDNDLIYTDDIWDILRNLYSPTDLLNGEVTMDDLYSDLYDKHSNDEETYIEVYDRLDFVQQLEIDELADEE